MKISVVIIVYNLERFIGAAIDSVLKQTRPADEVIVVDDCSTDGSAQIVKSYGNRVRYVRMPQNNGALLTALAGVKRVSGDVICMLDGDDVWAPNKLQVVVESFQADPELMLLSHEHIRVDKDGNRTFVTDETHRNIRRILASTSDPMRQSEIFRDSILAQKGYWLGSAYSFRRTCLPIGHFEAHLRKFDHEKLKSTYLDLVIAPYLVLVNPHKHVGYRGETYFLYRIHENASLSNNVSVQGAIHSLCKGRNINQLIYHFMKLNGASRDYLERRRLLVEEYDYLADVYQGKILHSLRGFFRLSSRLWAWRKTRKELARLIGCIVLGPAQFLRLKHKSTFK